MAWRYDRRQRRPYGLILVVGLILAAGGLGLWRAQGSTQSNHAASQVQTQAADDGALSDDHIQGRYLLNGTVTWSRGVEQFAGADSAQPFSQLSTFNPDQYDAWTASLECPITDNIVSFQSEVANLQFNCPPRFLPEAMKYFTIYDLANNHTYDQAGETGLAQTREYLAKVGAQYFGTYDSADTDNICDVIALPVRVGTQRGNLPVAFCGWQYFGRDPTEQELSVMDRYQKVMPVFAFVEAGVEYRAAADDRQVSVGQKLVDHGADFVIINSPHWVQNTSVYKGKLIVYSMGNFIFDQLDAETNRSVSIDVIMNIESSDNARRWLELGDSCKVYHDNCLAEAESRQLQKLSPAYTFGVVAGEGGYKVLTHKASQEAQQSVEQRTNWADTCAQLGYNRCQ